MLLLTPLLGPDLRYSGVRGAAHCRNTLSTGNTACLLSPKMKLHIWWPLTLLTSILLQQPTYTQITATIPISTPAAVVNSWPLGKRDILFLGSIISGLGSSIVIRLYRVKQSGIQDGMQNSSMMHRVTKRITLFYKDFFLPNFSLASAKVRGQRGTSSLDAIKARTLSAYNWK